MDWWPDFWDVFDFEGQVKRKNPFRHEPISAWQTGDPSEYERLRARAFEMTRDDLRLPRPPREDTVWAAVMDADIEETPVTVFTVVDGRTMVCLGSGDVARPSESTKVRQAAMRFVAVAERHQRDAVSVASHPRPYPGDTAIYLRTDVGMLMHSVSKEDLLRGGHPLTELVNAGWAVLAECGKRK